MPWVLRTLLDGDTGQKFTAQVWEGSNPPENQVSSAITIFNAVATTIPNDGVNHDVEFDSQQAVTGVDLEEALGTFQILVNTTGWYDVTLTWEPIAPGPDDDTTAFFTVNGVAQLVNPAAVFAQFLDGANNINWKSPFTVSFRRHFTATQLLGMQVVCSVASTADIDVLASLTVSGPFLTP